MFTAYRLFKFYRERNPFLYSLKKAIKIAYRGF
jgi:hypothetical protein